MSQKGRGILLNDFESWEDPAKARRVTPVEDDGTLIHVAQVLKGSPLNTQVSVGTTATLLPTTALTNRRLLVIQNVAATRDLFIGDVNVTTANGCRIDRNGGSITLEVTEDSIWYGIVATGTVDVRVLEVAR